MLSPWQIVVLVMALTMGSCTTLTVTLSCDGNGQSPLVVLRKYVVVAVGETAGLALDEVNPTGCDVQM